MTKLDARRLAGEELGVDWAMISAASGGGGAGVCYFEPESTLSLDGGVAVSKRKPDMAALE